MKATKGETEDFVVWLYEKRLVSQGRAALMLKVSRAEFLDILGKHGVSAFQYSAEEVIAEALETPSSS